MRHFTGNLDASLLDRSPFVFHHDLENHPALSLESLAKTIPQLPPRCLSHSKGLDNLAINFDRSFDEHRNGLSLMESFERLKEVSSYITIMDPMEHPAFADLYADLKEDVEELQARAGRPARVYEGRMWIFIASPQAITPFHFDRYSNFLMQIRGTKEMAVFPNFREDIISARDYESYMDREPSGDLWRDELDIHAKKYEFRQGAALHIPFAGGHYVKNGPDEVSVSLSFFFQTTETHRWVKAMQFNNRIRRRLGVQLGVVGKSRLRDQLKASAFGVVTGASALAKRALRAPSSG